MISVFNILSNYCSLDDMPRFATKQGVVGVLYDEIKQMTDCPFDRFGLGKIVRNAEKQKTFWDVQKNDIADLDQACKFLKLKVLVFKGYAMSRLYDRPESRKSGDIDVFFFDANHHNAGDVIDDLAQKSNIEITGGWKHSSFDLGDSLIENHRHFVGFDEHPRFKSSEDFLLDEIKNDKLVLSKEWENVYYPSPDFNAILLSVHFGEHFVYEGACLRHLVDWAVFLQKCGDKVRWNEIYALADQCGYRQWLDVMNAIAKDHFGVSLNFIPEEFINTTKKIIDLESKVLKELANSKPFDREARENTPLKYMLQRTRMAISDRWKLHMVYDESTWKWYLRHAWDYIRNN